MKEILGKCIFVVCVCVCTNVSNISIFACMCVLLACMHLNEVHASPVWYCEQGHTVAQQAQGAKLQPFVVAHNLLNEV